MLIDLLESSKAIGLCPMGIITKQLADFKDVVNGTMFVKNEHFLCRTKMI